jgi:hypothetical protein
MNKGTTSIGSQSNAPKKPFRLFRRGPWENAATVIIACGVLMLMQPFSLTLYSWSFATTLTGTVMFIIVSKFKD